MQIKRRIRIKREEEADRRGKTSEERVARALESIKLAGEIHHYYRTWPFGELDLQAIDFQVYPESDWLINLQVKSSARYKRRHIQAHGMTIPCVVVNEDMDDRQLVSEVMRVLGIAIEIINERH